MLLYVQKFVIIREKKKIKETEEEEEESRCETDENVLQ